MLKHTKKYVIALLFITLGYTGFCNQSYIPADPRPRTVKQSNGKTLTFFIRGDEHIHWCETIDGYTLLYNEKGELEFACTDENGTLQPSGILACNEADRGEEEKSFVKENPPKLFFSAEQVKYMRTN